MSDTSKGLAEIIWDGACAAARFEFGDRIAALEQDVADLRDALQKPPPVPEPQSLRA